MKIDIKDADDKVLYSHEEKDNTLLRTLLHAINNEIDLTKAVIKDVTFRGFITGFYGLGITFNNVRFENVDLTNSTFTDCSFTNCTFHICCFNCTMVRCKILNSSFIQSRMNDSSINDCSFRTCDFSTFNFYRSYLYDVLFRDSTFDDIMTSVSIIENLRLRNSTIKSAHLSYTMFRSCYFRENTIKSIKAFSESSFSRCIGIKYASCSFDSHGECGRILNVLEINKELIFSCGCFLGNKKDLLAYIKNDHTSYKVYRTRKLALKTVCKLINAGKTTLLDRITNWLLKK